MTKITISEDSDFSLANIPFGIFSGGARKRAGTRVGDWIVDLGKVVASTPFEGLNPDVFSRASLNDFIGLGKDVTVPFRLRLQELLRQPESLPEDAFVPASQVQMHVPVDIGDYTDFYSSIEHATNVGMMFRDPENALLPNWRHLPVGYHGRASSIVPTGQSVHRPMGQTRPDEGPPVFGPSKRVDFELEMGFVLGKETKLGEQISVADAEDHIFGLVLFNDWSARDIQKWEYVPLGPFLAKSFASSVSPWIVTLEALEPFRVQGPVQDPPVLPYLKFTGSKNYDIQLEVGIAPENTEETVVSKSNFKYMYWNMCQQLAHHTSNGCNVRVGDLMASGTISGKDESSYGSMLELAWAGQRPVSLSNGDTRIFIKDGDTVTMRGYGIQGSQRVGFGEVSTKLLPARES